MSKLDDAQRKAKKILEEMEDNATTSDVHVASSSSSTASSRNTNDDIDSDAVAELTGDLQRLQAEFANYKRRAEVERNETMDYAKARVVREFLTVRDSFEQELQHRPATIDPTWAASIDAIRSQFDTVLTGLGVESFDSVGQPFDPHLHEAIAADGSGDTVTEELATGYKLGYTILRHALVKVGGDSEGNQTHAPEVMDTPDPSEKE